MANKAQFIEQLAERFDGDRKRAAAALDAVIDTVYAAVSKGERVALTGFGIFERRERAARMARNPATGAAVRVKKTAVPAFRAGAEFKAIASGARKIAVQRGQKAAAVVQSAAADVRDAVTPAKKAPARKASAAKAAAKKAPAKKAPAKKAPAKKAPAKKAPAKKARPRRPRPRRRRPRRPPAKKTGALVRPVSVRAARRRSNRCATTPPPANDSSQAAPLRVSECCAGPSRSARPGRGW